MGLEPPAMRLKIAFVIDLFGEHRAEKAFHPFGKFGLANTQLLFGIIFRGIPVTARHTIIAGRCIGISCLTVASGVVIGLLCIRVGCGLSTFGRCNAITVTGSLHGIGDTGSGLAQEITKDPYNFAFTGITKPYNERILKDALLNNITRFLTELGTGFAYVGKEYRLQVGETENFIDLLFYNLNLSCYVVIEVKIGKFSFNDVGQLGGYVVACNHILRKEGRDNPTIGLLICKEKDRIQAQYALESSSQPIGISEYDLERFYPEKIEGTMPTIEELELSLGDE